MKKYPILLPNLFEASDTCHVTHDLFWIFEYNSLKSKGSLNSLEKFKNHNELYIAIKISENNLGYNETNKILNIPFYYVPFLVHTLKQGELNNLISLIKKNC